MNMATWSMLEDYLYNLENSSMYDLLPLLLFFFCCCSLHVFSIRNVCVLILLVAVHTEMTYSAFLFSCLMFALQTVDCDWRLFALCVCFIETCRSGLPKGRILSSAWVWPWVNINQVWQSAELIAWYSLLDPCALMGVRLSMPEITAVLMERNRLTRISTNHICMPLYRMEMCTNTKLLHLFFFFFTVGIHFNWISQ